MLTGTPSKKLLFKADHVHHAVQYNTWLPSEMPPKGVVSSFLFLDHVVCRVAP